MQAEFVSRLSAESLHDIWHILRHEAAVSAAVCELRPYSMVIWNGWEYVRRTYNFDGYKCTWQGRHIPCRSGCYCWNCRPDLFPPVEEVN